MLLPYFASADLVAQGFGKPEPALEFAKSMAGEGRKVLALVDVDLEGVTQERVDRFLASLESLGVGFGRVTGHDRLYLEDLGHKCGLFVVQKPYDRDDLVAIVDAAFQSFGN